MATNEEMRAWLEKRRKMASGRLIGADCVSDRIGPTKELKIIDSILSALEQPKPPNDKLIQAVKDYLEWVPTTGSDRDLHESKFRKALDALDGVLIRNMYILDHAAREGEKEAEDGSKD
jgi:hypothetical protein